MFTQVFDFKKVELESRKYCNKPNTVYMTKHGTGNKVWSRLNLSADLSRKSGLQEGDRVDLMQCGTMFALKKEKAGLLTIRKQGKCVLCINSTDLCRHLRAETKQATEFDAFISDGMVVFKPKE